MFEKEANEYAMLNARQYIHNESIGFCTSEEEVRQAYQKGAEFGYNKCDDQLTKAKEIIREYMRFEPMIGTCSFYSEEYEKTKKKAEQFLNSEVEK